MRPLPVNPDGIPEELRNLPRWLLWRLDWTNPAKPRKQPESVFGGPEWGDPSQLTTFDKAYQKYKAHGYAGVGFVLGDGIVGVDLDKVIVDGKPQQWAKDVVSRLGSYTEFSPSRSGVHVLLRGNLPPGRRADHDRGIEIYSSGRWFACTGAKLNVAPSGILDRSEQVTAVYDEFFKPEPLRSSTSSNYVSSPSDDTETAIEALAHLATSRVENYTDWVNVGMALHAISPQLLGAWVDWSRRSDKYRAGECESKWKGFTGDGGLKIGSLVEWAKQDSNGAWKPRYRRPVATPPQSLPAGTKVRATDRDNIGEVIEDRGETAIVLFIGADGSREKELPKSILRHADGRALDAKSPAFKLDLIDSRTFAETHYDQSFLVKGVMVAGQPCIIGGAQKSMKTGIAVDLAISLGTGTPFLGQFSITRRIRAAIISGESGAFTLQETGKRIALSRLRELADANVYWGFKLPQLGLDDHLKALADTVVANDIEAIIIDPAYLALLRDNDGQPINFANLFSVGSALIKVSEAFAATNCTPIILHHESKGAANQRRSNGNAPMELQDLSMSGFAEWARQWMLISRREPYAHGTGDHHLWLNVGGSAGHGGLYAVDIAEGIQNEDFTGRKWEVKVSTSSGVKEQAAEKKRKASDQKRERILDVLQKNLEGMSKSNLSNTAGIDPKTFGPIFEEFVSEGIIESCDIVTGRNKPAKGWRLADRGEQGFTAF